MKIEEKVLKEVFDEFFDKDIIEDAYVNSYLDEQIGNGLKKAIDLTLTEVDKTHVTNKFMLEKLKEQRKVDRIEVGKVINELPARFLNDFKKKQLKQKLGIK